MPFGLILRRGCENLSTRLVAHISEVPISNAMIMRRGSITYVMENPYNDSSLITNDNKSELGLTIMTT